MMCTVVLMIRPGHPWPLMLAGNRDERLDRLLGPARRPVARSPGCRRREGSLRRRDMDGSQPAQGGGGGAEPAG